MWKKNVGPLVAKELSAWKLLIKVPVVPLIQIANPIGFKKYEKIKLNYIVEFIKTFYKTQRLFFSL